MTEIVVTVYGEAQPAGSKRAFAIPGGRVNVVDANKRSAPWKQQVARAAVEAMAGADDGRFLDGPLYLSLVFYRPRPKGHYTPKGEVNATGRRNPRPTTKPDALKLARGVEDALTGIVYRDDSQICVEYLEKRYGEPARVEIRAFQIEERT